MARLIRIYYHALFGALGGLLGWMLFGEFVQKEWHWWSQALVGGGMIGGMIGYCAVGVDALMDRAFVRFSRFAAHGALMGALGGAAGFWIGDWVNYLLAPSAEASDSRLLGAVVARGLGWMVFGLAVGAGEGIAARSWLKFLYGAVGGSLGGLAGGAAFGLLMEGLAKETAGYTWGQAIGLVLLGGGIGALIAIVEEVFRPAGLRVLRGWHEGREYSLVKAVSVIGRDEGADILLLRDMQVAKRHAVIERQGNKFLFINNTQSPAELTQVNGKSVSQASELHDGDRIQLGNVVLKFTVRS
jgi:hypothetical protein